jgi:glycosyltransferase involved in cell wall biosynthesis
MKLMYDLELDSIIYSLQRFGGATRYWRELTSRLHEVLPNRKIHESQSTKLGRFWQPKSSAKVFHSSHFRISSSQGVVNVATIYDLIYERGLVHGVGAPINLYERKRAISKADVIICISNSTRRDLIEFYDSIIRSKPIHVIHLGCDSAIPSPYAPFSSPSFLGEKGKRFKGFFLFVGGRAAYKNFDLFLSAFIEGQFVVDEFAIICTGASFSPAELRRLDELGLGDFVFSVGVVTSEKLLVIYKAAAALVYPSSYEGFGLPPLEAMAAGCPVICANVSSLPEVVGDSGLLVNADSVVDLARAMREILEEGVRRRLIVSGFKRVDAFSWNKTAVLHADVYNSLGVFE